MLSNHFRVILKAGAIAAFLSGRLAAQTFCVPPKAVPPPPPPQSPPPICQPKECDKCTKSPCYVATGIYARDAVDLTIPTAGTFSLIASRLYDSSHLTDGPLGVGWSSSLTPRLYYATYLLAAPSTYSHEADVEMPDGVMYRFTVDGSGVFSPPAGRYDKLLRNGDGTYSLTLQHTRTVYSFAADGSVSSLADDFGNVIAWTYDSAGRVQRVADNAGSGRYMDLTWGADGRLSTLTDNTGRNVKYYYDTATGTLTGVADPVVSSNASLRSTNYTYAPGRFGQVLTRITDRWNRLISALEWYNDGKLKSYTDGAYDDATPANSVGEKYTYQYFPNSTQPTTTKSSSLGSTSYTYDTTGLVNPQLYTNGLALTATGPGGGQFHYDYDSSGRVTKIAAPSPEPPSGVGTVVWFYTYDSAWPEQVASVIPKDLNGNLKSNWAGWVYDYYPLGSTAPGALQHVWRVRTDKVTRDLVATYYYTSHGRLAGSTDDNGFVTAYTYNAAGDLESVTTSGIPSVTQLTHDSLGRQLTITDANNHTTTATYDLNDRILSITLPKPSAATSYDTITTFSYDNYDSATGLTFTNTTDPNGRVTASGFDALGHLAQNVDAAGNITRFTYQYDLVHEIRDANGNTTTYGYNPTRDLSNITYPDGATETYNFSDGQLFARTDRRGFTIRYAYDALGRLASSLYDNLFNNFGGRVGQFYGYDGQNLTGMDDWSGGVTSHTYSYDSSWRLTVDNVTAAEKKTYSYIGTGSLVSSYTIEPPFGTNTPTQSVSYGYGPNGETTSETWSWLPNAPFTFEYTPSGEYSRMTFPNGAQRVFSYDNQDRLTSIINRSPSGGTTASFEYAYDYDWQTGSYTMRGQKTSVLVTAPSASNIVSGLTKYSYDGRYQLVRADYPDSTFEAWTYDAIGNRLSRRTTFGSTFPHTYYLNSSGGNTARLRNDGVSSNDFTYDAAGNLTGANGLSNAYVWDYAGRLASYGGQTYTYDAFGRTATASGGSTTRYISMNSNTVGERNSTAGAVTDYIFGPGIDEPLAKRTANGAISYFGADGLGSIVMATDSAGVVLNSTGYSPWGDTQTVPTELFGYTGREKGGPSWYYRSRYYDALRGRFLSEDPLRIFGSWNLYNYVDNDPVMYVDPLGLTKHKPDSEYCRSLLKKIANLRSEIAERMRKIKENPRDLPFCNFGGKPRDSVFEHMLIVSELELNLMMRSVQYMRDCGGNSPPPLIPMVPSFGGQPNPSGGGGRVTFPLPLPQGAIPDLLPPLIHPCLLNPGMPGCDPSRRCDMCAPGGT